MRPGPTEIIGELLLAEFGVIDLGLDQRLPSLLPSIEDDRAVLGPAPPGKAATAQSSARTRSATASAVMPNFS